MSEIVSVRIHPAIGIARIGNSEEDYFVGPEVPYRTPEPEGGYRDASGRLKRQAARFRLFGYDASGRVVREVTSDDADITWTVHVANKKAAWYDFVVALDLAEATGVRCPRRNAYVAAGDRDDLIIDPGSRTVGPGDAAQAFDSGRFFDLPVYLGEIFTDEQGRLLFLGGRGVSRSAFAGNPMSTFSNNSGWHDDISDGPVNARIVIDGTSIDADPAWVVVAPPNYAPDVVTPQTMYDVMYDAVAGFWVTAPERPSFTSHILPLLSQCVDAQWVNAGFLSQFGWQAPNDFLRPELLAKLSAPGEEYQELRLQVTNMFRDPSAVTAVDVQWPYMYGDAFGNYSNSPHVLFTVTPTLYRYLRQWAKGDFVSDYTETETPASLDAVSLQEQPGVLDKAALHFCMGGPFHPGCEMTWPMRQRYLYRAPFRLKQRPENIRESDYGQFMTQDIALSDDGPLSQSGPGDISKWMALPWQADTASCRSGYPVPYLPADPYLPTFWPSRVPNQVLAEEDYRTVMESTDAAERVAAFNTRRSWLRGLDLEAPYLEQIATMVDHFGDLGVVVRKPGPQSDPDLPPVMYVETGVALPEPPAARLLTRAQHGREQVDHEFMKARFGWPGRRR
ncbi:MAG: LodA/GoxA family CTQ-dependent oxidase [Actinomycetota bacterium]